MADAQVIDSFKRNGTEEVRATLSTFHGQRYLDLRIYYQDEADEFKPTKKGINLSVELIGKLVGMVDKLAKAVQQLPPAEAGKSDQKGAV